MQPLGRGLFKGADCLLLVYDVTSRESFAALDGFYSNFLAFLASSGGGAPLSQFPALPSSQHAQPGLRPHSPWSAPGPGSGLEDFPCILVGNKSDLAARRDVSMEEVLDWCTAKRPRRPITYIECSVAHGTAVKDVFLLLACAVVDAWPRGRDRGSGVISGGGDVSSTDDESDSSYYDSGSSSSDGDGDGDGNGGEGGGRGPGAASSGVRYARGGGGPHTPSNTGGGSSTPRLGPRVRLTPSSADTCALVCLWGSGS